MRRSPSRPNVPLRTSSRTPAGAREIVLGAEDYADEILNTLEINLSKFTAAVERGRGRHAGKDAAADSG